ncbi:MAG: hypothetical protein ABSF26_12785 [Thermoguttaceae bacterium]|jgi:hypothetical protein
MPKRTRHYYLVKIARLSGWTLLPLMILYIGTGFALCGMLGFDRLVDYQSALVIHRVFDWPLVALFLVHVSITTYFALRRWGWIKSHKCR